MDLSQTFAQFALVPSPVDSSYVVGYTYVNGANKEIRIPFPVIAGIAGAVVKAQTAANTATNQAAIATTQAGIAVTKAGEASVDAAAAALAKQGAVAAAESVGSFELLADAQTALTAGEIPLNKGVYVTNDTVDNMGFWVNRAGVLVKESDATLPALAGQVGVATAGVAAVTLKVSSFFPDDMGRWDESDIDFTFAGANNKALLWIYKSSPNILRLDRDVVGGSYNGVGPVSDELDRWAESGYPAGTLAGTNSLIAFEPPTIIRDMRWQGSGYERSVIGMNYRLLDPSLSQAVQQVVSGADQYAIYSADDGAGKQAVFSRRRSDGFTIQLSKSGSNNVDPRFENGRAVWVSDRANAAPGGYYWSQLDRSAEVAYIPYLAGGFWGDSLTAQNFMRFMPGYDFTLPIYNFGRSSDTSRAVASRFGAYQNLFAVAGNSIPASGTVDLRQTGQGNPVEKFSNLPASVRGHMNGVWGDLAWTGTGHTFTRIGTGSAVAVTGSAEFIWGAYSGDSEAPTEADVVTNAREFRHFGFFGRNNNGESLMIFQDFEAFEAAIPTSVRMFGFAPYLPRCGPSEIRGTGEFRGRAELLANMQARWPEATLDLLPIMQAAGNGSTQDNLDIANGVTPTSLMKPDTIHPSDPGGQMVEASGVAPFLINNRGFLL